MTKQDELLHNLGIEALNVMQQEAVDAFRRTHHLVLLSPTGSGKTLAYLLPLVTHILSTAGGDISSLPWPQAIVMVPSRELASQTAAVMKAMSSGLNVMACYGGRPAMDEHRTMREQKPQVLIATPGRAADHLRKRNFDGTAVKTLVIDEFDKSLELGFHDEMADVCKMLPSLECRFLLSATDSERIPAFIGAGFTKLDFTASDVSDRLKVHLLRTPEKDKLHSLRALLCHLGPSPSMVFVNHRESVQRVADYLHREGFAVSAFHGGMEQRDRERALYRFVGGSALTLVCTDLAARGLDIALVRHVIHYHLPLTADTFTHRNGRTARWDNAGEAWVLIGQEENFDLVEGNKMTIGELEAGQVPEPQFTTFYIGRGRKDKVNRVDVVGFFSKVCGLRREELGRVDVGDHWAYAAVASSCVAAVLERAKGQKIKGQKALILPARD